VARKLKIKELQARKQALIAESDAYRQILRLELQNLRLRGAHVRRRASQWWFHPALRFLPLALGLYRTGFAGFRGKRRRGWLGLLPLAMAAWRGYRQFGPLFQHWFFSRKASNGEERRRSPEDRTPAGNI
jgi:hypothetical protein